MSLLARFRRSAKWLILATGVACLFVGALAVVPHDDEDGRSCLVCKARQEPLEALSVTGAIEAPSLTAADSPIPETIAPRSAVSISGPPRAPPA